VRDAFARPRARRAQILYKKIDSTLRGHLAAEIAAARSALGAARPVIVAPAFPAQGRIVRNGRVFVNGVPLSGNLRNALAGTGVSVPDAASDADLARIARAGLAAHPRPIFVGSAGLARALARALPKRRAAKAPRVPRRTVVTVVGSASPVSARQAARLARDASALLVQLAWTREPRLRDMPAVRRLGRLVAQVAPRSHLVLTGGETARAVLRARGIRTIRLLGEVEPGVPFGIARDGTLICTKAGAFGRPYTLANCMARLKREMK
jgi:uncharacterized protein YgbK (DUF1537 family)